MEYLTLNFETIKAAIKGYLQLKFNGAHAHIRSTDFDDCIQNAYLKLLIDQQKTQPKLNPSVATLYNLSRYALIDIYRQNKRKRLVSISDMDPSTTEEDAIHLERKQKIERIIAAVQQLRPQQKLLLISKFDAVQWTVDATAEEMIQFKNHPKQPFEAFGFPTDGAMRASKRKAILILMKKLCDKMED